MTKVKSPFNWVGNKYKHLEHINDLVKNKNYNHVYDLFLGSGNVLLNLECNANNFVGNDKIKLVPKLFKEIVRYSFTLDDVEQVLGRFDRFSTKESYYTFRDYWNEKYLSDNFDKKFIVESVLLLKMCSNSMVRFNPKGGYFNQGFRGLGKKEEFFTDTAKEICVTGLNQIKGVLTDKGFTFYNNDFINFNDKVDDSLLILDPPYILRSDMYTTDYTQEHDEKLLNIISKTKNDFIYFNYLERDGEVNVELQKVIDKHNYRVIQINDRTLSGQGRSNAETKSVSEVLVTNIL